MQPTPVFIISPEPPLYAEAAERALWDVIRVQAGKSCAAWPLRFSIKQVFESLPVCARTPHEVFLSNEYHRLHAFIVTHFEGKRQQWCFNLDETSTSCYTPPLRNPTSPRTVVYVIAPTA
jgi:hypothetical protein